MQTSTVLKCIRARRATRYFTEHRVTREQIMHVLEAGRWAPSAGNRRLHRFVAVLDPVSIRLIRAVSPGILGHPTALVVICIDSEKAARLGCKNHDTGVYIDVGTAAQNMLLAAEALGLGAGPVTSFSKEAVRTVMNLPASLSPEMQICLGYRVAKQPFPGSSPSVPTRLEDLVIWERFP